MWNGQYSVQPNQLDCKKSNNWLHLEKFLHKIPISINFALIVLASPLCLQTYSHPQFQNVMLPLLLNVVHWYFSKSCYQFYGGKKKQGRCSLKRMFWVGLISLRLAPALVFCAPVPLSALTLPQDKSWRRHAFFKWTTVSRTTESWPWPRSLCLCPWQ